MFKDFKIENKIRDKLTVRKKKKSLRSLQENSVLIDLCSNDYLGFSKTLEVKASKNCGASGSRLIRGNSSQYERIENNLATFHKAESGLIFNSGYSANIGLFSCIADKGDTIIYDQYIHASTRDGIRLSNARSFSFEHNNSVSLEKKLKQAEGHIIVAIESIYSMDGDQAPLEKIVRICKKYKAYIILDEAHATGVLGQNGEGLANSLNLESKLFARIHTFGKAMGCHGAVVLGSEDLKQYLINFARSFIYTTALPELSLNAIESAYNKLKKSPHIISQLHQNISLFKSLVSKRLKAKTISSSSPIQCILISGNETVKKVELEMQNKGFDVRAILHPTVEKGKERIRICIHSFNSQEEIKMCVSSLEKLIT